MSKKRRKPQHRDRTNRERIFADGGQRVRTRFPLLTNLFKVEDEDLTDRARGFAAVALGIVADKEPLPFNSKIAVDLNYRASTPTLNAQVGAGILNIL